MSNNYSLNDQNISKQILKAGLDGQNIAQNGGMVQTENMSEVQRSIFQALDTNKDGIIDQQEFQNFANKVDGSADKPKDKKIDLNELQNFFKNNENTKNVKIKSNDIIEFMQNYLNDGSSNDIKSAIRTYEGGKELVSITYNNGKQKIQNNTDNTTTIVSNNTSVEKRADGTLLKETIKTEKGTVTKEYAQDGKTIVKQTSVDNTTGTTTVSEFDGEVETSRVVTQGRNEKVYKYDKNSNELKIASEIVNKGHPVLEKSTEYSYSVGTTTITTKEGGKTSTSILDGENLEYQEIDDNGTITTMRQDYKTGNKTTVTNNPNTNTTTTTVSDENDNNLSQNITVNGKEYEVKYDGKGNTKIVIQNGETLDKLVEKFGCTKEQLLEVNGGKIRGWAGDEIVVPGELAANDAKLNGRKSADQVKADYTKYVEEHRHKKVKIDNGKYSEMAALFENNETVAAGIEYLSLKSNVYAVFTQYNNKHKEDADPKTRNIIAAIMNCPNLSEEEKNNALNDIRITIAEQLNDLYEANPKGKYKPISMADQKEWFSALDYCKLQTSNNYQRLNDVIVGLLNPVSNSEISSSSMRLDRNTDYRSGKGYGNIGNSNTFGQARTGNCMAVDTLQSFANTDAGRAYLNSLIQKPTEENPQIITVRLFDKNHEIQYYDIHVSDIEEASRKRVIGDKNAILLELAMQKCIDEGWGGDVSAYQNGDIGLQMLTGKGQKMDVAKIDTLTTSALNKSIILVPRKGAEKLFPSVVPEHGYMVQQFILEEGKEPIVKVQQPWIQDINADGKKREMFLTIEQFNKIFGEMYVQDIPKPLTGEFL